MSFDNIGVVGGGAWGTALAQTLTSSGRNVVIWTHETATAREINTLHTNHVFLDGVTLDARLRATDDLADLADRELILLVPPAQHLRDIAARLAPHAARGTPFVICAKGIEQATGKLLAEVLAEAAPGATAGIVSGPSFAAEVARGLPAALTVACADERLGERVAQALGSRQLRVYWTNDLIGVQLGGAVKNVLAIAAGIVDGRKLGASAHAALVTRGFAEMRRFAVALGARPETLAGLSGLGDLLLTCGSPQSRNMSLGRALGETMAVLMIIGPGLTYSAAILQPNQHNTIAAYIALQFPEANSLGVNSLIAMGLALFVITLLVNMLARWIVSRRSEFSGAN